MAPSSGTDLHHRAAGKLAQRRRNPLRGLRVDKEVLPELGFGWHLLLRW